MKADAEPGIRTGGFVVQVLSFDGNARLLEEGRRSSSILVLCGGALLERSRLGDLRLGAGDVVFRPRRFSRCFQVLTASCRAIRIEVTPSVRPEVWPLVDYGRGGIVFPAGVCGDLPFRIGEVMARSDAAAHLLLHGLILELIGGRTRSPNRDGHQAPAWLGRIEETIRQDLGRHFTVAALAGSVGVSGSWLRAAFRRHKGMTIFDYVRHQRIHAAARELLETRLSIRDIAYQNGFADQAHLSRSFKRAFGMTPREHRANGGAAILSPKGQ